MSETLPSSWALPELQHVAEIGPKFNAGDLPGQEPVHFVPMAAVAENFGGVDVSRLRPLSEVRKGYTFFAEGDVLFAKITPCMENGKGALVPHLERSHAFGSTEFHVLRPSEAVAGEWLAHFLSQPSFRKTARHNMTGTAGQLRVPTKWLQTVRMPAPPRAEQTRIVAKLEELLSDLDAGVAELKTAQKKLQQYRQSLLKAAVEGALTAPWREAQRKLGTPTETGAQLLQRILTERRARWEAKQLAKFKEQGKAPPKDWQKKYPEPVQPDTTDLPELPEGWVWASVEQLGNVTTGFTPSTTDAENFGGAVPFFKPSDLDAGYSVIAARDYLTEKGASAGRVLPALSVLVTCIGATIGKTGLARVACTTNQQINSISVDPDSAVPEFIFWFMNSGLGQRQIVNSASATTLPILNKSRFQRLAVPLPSRAEQQEMVRCIDAEVERCTQLAVSLNLSLKQSTAQRQNILRAAFAGQLVPQDPNDEPASVLLARIRAELASQAAQKKPRARKAREAA
ncbi:MAG: restriction endonuclease subunit S [Aquabacterium sp.]|nr:restriction endonuclease subunit S [Aquabacterium sp.]